MVKNCLFLSTFSLCVLGMAAGDGQAQVQGDATVGTQVTSSDQLNFDIDGGRQVGGNLFQSFRTFSVPINGSADFNSGPTVTNIISRVTGSAASNIDGLIRVPNSDANLFFINPNGIFFGPNARLSLDGSFLASTASQILFAGGDRFSATQPTSLLTVRTPIGLGFGPTAAPIQNQSRTTGRLGSSRRRLGDRTVGLQVNAGRTLALVGGDIDLLGGNLTAARGRVELASVGPGSRVDLSAVGQNWILDVPEGATLGNIRLSQGSLVTAGGRGTGSVQVQGQKLTLLNAKINATLSTNPVDMTFQGGTISLRVPGRIVLSGDSEVATRTRAPVSGGTVLIETGQLILRDGGTVTSSTVGENNSGDAGRVVINATDLIRVSGRNPSRRGQSAIFSQSVAGATGNAGRVKITTRRLVVENGGQVSVGAVEDPDPNGFGQGVSNGDGGSLSIMATDSILVTGVGIDENGDLQPSALIAEAQGEGMAGSLVLRTGQLLVQDQGLVTVSSLEEGSAGNISVLADTIRLEGGLLNAETATDSGGNIVLRAADYILLRQESMISTSGGIGNAGGDGGNIRIAAPLVVAVPGENSDIRTDAFLGNGGAVSINTDGLLGFSRPPLDTGLTNDITANSRFGLDGVVQVNTPEIDPSKDTVALPEVIRTAVLTQGCQAGQQGSQFIHTRRGGKPSEPQEIGSQSIWDDLRPSSIRRAVKAPSRWRGATTGLRKLPSPIRPLQEAQGWARDARGNLVLLAQAPNVTPNAFAQAAVPCHSY
ncbi:hypothetical protein C1752_00227 [Acaryochloris thomasi RCC1774]|uniref:Filamentous haemagglutinin FhaB/tRNA nuclease CdiA-like TPS domain-containing protein n=1 Tax=Acaryochloris thomasi RCC1774 TaxID=1764569 RepID=A0A2W1K4X3_9CYAN|nr:filamentous hemagglutinin N-terminal domain-containing protein [Acaryochloris thomasi]PZD75001.1 hypothetical protein C1752_00227 [Acaryochloris thomasi RCC1774]